jgi:hypothetical protein
MFQCACILHHLDVTRPPNLFFPRVASHTAKRMGCFLFSLM